MSIRRPGAWWMMRIGIELDARLASTTIRICVVQVHESLPPSVSDGICA